jgi:hypothetical protein
MLSVSSDQKTTILDPIDAHLQDAFSDGVGVASTQFLAAIEKYTDLTTEQQRLVRDTFRLVVASMLVAMNMKRVLPDVITDGSGYTGLIPYVDGNDFSSRNLIVQNGLIVGTT